MVARRSAVPQFLVLNLVFAGFAALGQVPGAEATMPDPNCDPRPATAIAVHGLGKVLVRWWGGSGASQSLDMAEVSGFWPSIEVQRSVDGGAWAVVEPALRRAATAAEAEARLTAEGGDDTALLVDTVKAVWQGLRPLEPGFAPGTMAPYTGQVLLDALDFLEAPEQVLARMSLADRAWRVAWALGLGWVDLSPGAADVNHHFRYRVYYTGAEGAMPVLRATTQDLKFQDGPDHITPPSGMNAHSIDDLPAPEDGLADGSDWESVQRRRWMDRAIAIHWDLADPPGDCPASPAENGLAAAVEWPHGYNLYRRPNCPDPMPSGDHPCKHLTKVNEVPVFPMPARAEGVGFEAFFVDNATAGLVLGAEYCYRARALSLLGDEGPDSGEDCATLLETIPPLPPRDFEVTLKSNKPHLTWTAPLAQDCDVDASRRMACTEGAAETVSKYEVWRTKVLRQDLLPPPGEPPNGTGTSADRWKLLKVVVPSAGQEDFAFTDGDPTILPGEHRWYKVRAFDVPPKGATFTSNGATKAFEGNPSPFTRPLSTGPKDIYPPQRCPDDPRLNRTYGDFAPFSPLGGANASLLAAKVRKGCTPIHMPLPGDILASTPGDGCLEFPLPLHPDVREVKWYQGNDATPKELHLTKVFKNNGQTKFCNPLGLEWPMPICVKLQGVDAVWNQGDIYPLLPGECYYPSFSDQPVPGPPKPTITKVEPGTPPGNAVIHWTSASRPWLEAFYVVQHAEEDLVLDPAYPSCPLWPWPPGWVETPASAREATMPLLGPLVHFTLIARSTENKYACSEPFAYQDPSLLDWAYHTSKFHIEPTVKATLGDGVAISWANPGCRTGPDAPFYVLYRSLSPNGGYTPLTPPIQGCRYEDATAPDGRYYYQLAIVGHGRDAHGAIVDGELVAVSNPGTDPNGPLPQWPNPPVSSECGPGAPPNAKKTIQWLTFGEGATGFRMRVCWHYEEPASVQDLGDIVAPYLGYQGDAVPGEAPVQLGAEVQFGSIPGTIGGGLQNLPPAKTPVPSPVKVNGFGMVEFNLPPPLGTRSFPHTFQGLTVLPQAPPCCINPEVVAKVLAGKVTQADSVVYPLPISVDTSGALFRYRLDTITLDSTGAKGKVTLRLPPDLRVRIGTGSASDDLALGTVTLTNKLEFKKNYVVPGSPNQCSASQVKFAFEMTTLPLRLIPDQNFTVTPKGMTAVTWCTAYLDPYAPGGTHPPRPAATSPYAVNTNDAFLAKRYTGPGKVGPKGAHAVLGHTGTLAWVTGAPMGVLVEGQGASVVVAGGRLTGGTITGPVVVRTTYRVDVGGASFASPDPVRKSLRATFPQGLTILDGGAMRGTAGALDAADAAVVPWQNGAVRLDDLDEPIWELVLGPVQTRQRLIADFPGTDDELTANGLPKELLSPLRRNESQLVGLGLNYFTQAPKKFTWECPKGGGVHLEQDTSDVAINLRHAGLNQAVKLAIAPEGIGLSLYGYDARLLNFHVVFLDSDEQRSAIRVRLTLPYPADFDLLILNLGLDSEGCPDQGEVPPEPLLARAWDVTLVPETAEFREQPSNVMTLWLLGWGQLPHLEGPKPPAAIQAAAPGAVPFDHAWSPKGQALDSFAPHPQLRLDGFNFTATKLRLSKALIPGVDEDEQPGTAPGAWAKGTLGRAPCPGIDPGSASVRQGRCPVFLRYEGYPVLPYWGQAKAKVKVTTFGPDAHLQDAGGSAPAAAELGPAAMPTLKHLGLDLPPEFERAWSEASGVQGQVEMFFAQKPGSLDPKGLFAGLAQDVDFGPSSVMDLGSIVSSVVPCPVNDPGKCLPGDPSVFLGSGMGALPGVLSGVADLLQVDITVEVDPEALADALLPDIENMFGASNGLALEDLETFAEVAKALPVEDLEKLKDCAADPGAECFAKAEEVVRDLLEDYAGDVPELGDIPGLNTGDLPLPAGNLSIGGGSGADIMAEFDIGVGEMTTTFTCTEKKNGDCVHFVIHGTVKFDDRSENNFLTAENISLTIDSAGIVLLEGKGIEPRMMGGAGPKSVDVSMRFEKTSAGARFDAGISMKDWQLGSLQVLSAQGVFGAGKMNGETSFYFGFTGEGYDQQNAVAGGFGMLLGQLDAQSQDIVAGHGFGDLVSYLKAGDAGPDAAPGPATIAGAYGRIYASGTAPVVNYGCAAQLTGGGEAAFWFFEQDAGTNPNDGGSGATFGGKIRMFLTGTVACLVSVRGDLSLTATDTMHPSPLPTADIEAYIASLLHQTHLFTFIGDGWVAGGVGLCDPGSWTSWFPSDSICFICGMRLVVTVQAEVYLDIDPGAVALSVEVVVHTPTADASFDCGLG